MPNQFWTGMGNLATQAAGNVIGSGMGLILGGIERKKQREQQEALQNIQMRGQMSMTDYNMQKQLEMWQATGYGAQKEQMKAAGINPALMYGMGGGGGQTTNIEAGQVTGGQARQGGEAAAMGIQMGQTAMMTAQIELLKAQTAKTQAEIPQIGAQTTNIQEQTKLVTQNIKNAEQQQKYTQAMTAWQQLETTFAQDSYGNRQEQIQEQLNQTIATVKSIGLQNKFTEETWKDAANQIAQNVIQTSLHSELLKAQKDATKKGIELTDAQITKITADIAQGWKKLELEGLQGQRESIKLLQTDLDLLLKEMQTQFNITHPGLWNVVGGTVESTIKQNVEAIKEKMRNLIPKL